LIFPQVIFAKYDPLTVPNNKYGIHIVDFNDLAEARNLVNSTGGDWGYVTLVIQDGQKHASLWQDLFNQMRRLHLIPIVRIATHISGESWSIPQKVDAEDWARFLDSLVWPVENRYVVIFNEPNHANEWGGSLNPENYADVFVEYANKFRAKNDNFYILPAALDVSASNSPQSMDAQNYWKRMINTKPEILDLIDGWNSHSYPNPAFSASPDDSGRGSVRSYKWELNYLEQIGLKRKLPVFITETGWKHSQGKSPDFSLLDPVVVANYINRASQTVWNDPDIAAVTPFVFNYQDIPFDHFSWKQIGAEGYYPFFETFKNIPKIAGHPKQKQSYLTIEADKPQKLVSSSFYQFGFKVKNTGQNIFDSRDAYSVDFDTDSAKILFRILTLPVIEPDQVGDFRYLIKTPPETGKFHVSVRIGKEPAYYDVTDFDLEIIPPPSLVIRTSFGFKMDSSTRNASVLIYDKKDRLLHEFKNISFSGGSGKVEYLTNVIPGNTYRVVLTVPGYLPRQTITRLSGEITSIQMKRMLPFDLNNDGQFNADDLKILIMNGSFVLWQRFF
jgi:hypothetical protein